MTQEDAAEIAAFVHSLAILADRPKFLWELVLKVRSHAGEGRARRLPFSQLDTVPEPDCFGDWEH